MLLAGCGGGTQGVTAEQLVGVWRQEDHQALADSLETAYEAYFTEDGRLYILVSSDALDIGYHTRTLECAYSVENGALHWAQSGAENALSGAVTDIRPKADHIVLTVREGSRKRSVTLIKVSDAVPDAYTPEGAAQAAAEEQARREEIIAFSEKLSAQTGLPLQVDEGEDFLLDVPGGVGFSSGEAKLHITQGKYAEGDETIGYTVAVPSGAMYYSAPCYVVEGYAVVFDSGEAPKEWREALTG